VANAFDRITHHSNVLGGRATVRGLRISLAHVVNLVANGMTAAQIVEDLPDLERKTFARPSFTRRLARETKVICATQ
jgi:uncharacterized protein (DUF433 family)